MTRASAVVTMRLKYLVEDEDRHGNPRLYVRKKGRRKIRIYETPGTDIFLEAYKDALAGKARPKPGTKAPEPRVVAATGSLRWLVEVRYYHSAEFKRLEPSTQGTRKNILKLLLNEQIAPDDPGLIGTLPFADIPAEKIAILRDRKADRPHSANDRLKAIRHVFEYAKSPTAKLMAKNPANEVPYIATKGGGYHTWTLPEIAQFITRHPIGTKAYLAMMLLLLTGQRRSDVVLFGRQHVRQPEHIAQKFREIHPGKWLAFTQHKNRNSKPVSLTVPLLPLLERILALSPCGDMTFLVTEFGKPFTAAGFGNWFHDRCVEADVPGRAHGLRKAGATFAAENGATAHQLMAMYGWTTLKQPALYTKAADQQRLAGGAMTLLLPWNETASESVPPDKAVQESETLRAVK